MILQKSSLFCEINYTKNKKDCINLLLLHDIFYSHHQFDSFIKNFKKNKIAENFNIILVDLYGHGPSGGDRYRLKKLEEYAASTIDLLNEIRLREKIKNYPWIFLGIGLGADVLFLISHQLQSKTNINLKALHLINPYFFLNFPKIPRILEKIKVLVPITPFIFFFNKEKNSFNKFEKNLLNNKFVFLDTLMALMISYNKNQFFFINKNFIYYFYSPNDGIHHRLNNNRIIHYQTKKFSLDPFAIGNSSDLFNQIIKNLCSQVNSYFSR